MLIKINFLYDIIIYYIMDFYNLILGKKSHVDDGKQVSREMDTKEENKIKKDIASLVKKRNKVLKIKGYEKLFEILKPVEDKTPQVINNGGNENKDVDDNEIKKIEDQQKIIEDSIYQEIADNNPPNGHKQLNDRVFKSRLDNFDKIIHLYKQHDTNYNRKKIKEFEGKRRALLIHKQKLDNGENLKSSYYHQVLKRNKKYQPKKPEINPPPKIDQPEIKISNVIPIKNKDESNLNQGNRILNNINNNQNITVKKDVKKDVKNDIANELIMKIEERQLILNNLEAKKNKTFQNHADILKFKNELYELRNEFNNIKSSQRKKGVNSKSPIKKAPELVKKKYSSPDKNNLDDKLVELQKLVLEKRIPKTKKEHDKLDEQIKEKREEINDLSPKVKQENQQKSQKELSPVNFETMKDDEEEKEKDIEFIPKEITKNKKYYKDIQKKLLTDIDKIEGQIKYGTVNGQANGKQKLSKLQLEGLPTAKENLINKLKECEENLKKITNEKTPPKKERKKLNND